MKVESYIIRLPGDVTSKAALQILVKRLFFETLEENQACLVSTSHLFIYLGLVYTFSIT